MSERPCNAPSEDSWWSGRPIYEPKDYLDNEDVNSLDREAKQNLLKLEDYKNHRGYDENVLFARLEE